MSSDHALKIDVAQFMFLLFISVKYIASDCVIFISGVELKELILIAYCTEGPKEFNTGKSTKNIVYKDVLNWWWVVSHVRITKWGLGLFAGISSLAWMSLAGVTSQNRNLIWWCDFLNLNLMMVVSCMCEFTETEPLQRFLIY